jgi:hypothetical protein
LKEERKIATQILPKSLANFLPQQNLSSKSYTFSDSSGKEFGVILLKNDLGEYSIVFLRDDGNNQMVEVSRIRHLKSTEEVEANWLMFQIEPGKYLNP